MPSGGIAMRCEDEHQYPSKVENMHVDSLRLECGLMLQTRSGVFKDVYLIYTDQKHVATSPHIPPMSKKG